MFYQTQTTVNIDAGKSATHTFTLGQGTQPTLIGGTYTAKVVILYDGNEVDKKEIVFSLEPRFEILEIRYSKLEIGKEGTITVEVKNTGNASGEAKVTVKLLDLLDEEKVIWLEPEEIGTLNFRLQVPSDFEDGSYTGVVSEQWSVNSGQ
ncbi:MAG: hypothetical protein AB1567_07515 [bacterium]